MNNAEKVELFLIYGECQRNVRLAAVTYAERYPERYHLSYNYVLRLLRGLNQEGRYPGRQMNQQRRRANMFDDDTELQTVVYADPPVNLQDLKNKIQAACDILSEEQIKAATSIEFLRRLESCLEHNGENFEQFIR
ncbi:hypothetical protein QTP88_017883 [Uroleucon formosanum]